ncbi:MAG: endonuclease/exonuclease/phosphatase family protein [Muribaculaceae bacterium]|nr:endonuclease/exonuclease/phosphatase family protein [Muribaculaceae bacterium]
MIIISPIIRLVCKILSFILYLCTLVAAFGGYCNPEYFALPSVFTLMLPWLGMATFFVTLIWLFTRNWITGIAGAFTLVASWGTLGDAAPLSFPKSVPDGAQTFTLLTFNCLHLNDLKNPTDLSDNRAVRFLLHSGADIICLQELINIEDPVEVANLPESLRDSLYAAYPYRAGDRKMDLKVYSKYPLEMIPFATNGRRVDAYQRKFARFVLKIRGRKLNLINMHLASYNLTSDEREVMTEMTSVKGIKESMSEFKGSIFGKLKQSFRNRSDNIDDIIELTRGSAAPVIVCGDFNDVAGSWSYRKMREAGFHDAFSETVFGPRHTFNQHLMLFHIDQIFYRGPLEALSVKRLSLNTSDHYPLIAEFAFLPDDLMDY